MARDSKRNNNNFFAYIRGRKPASDAVAPLDDKRVKGN